MQRKSVVLVAILAALTMIVTFAITRPALSATAPVRIMPLGDSITGGPGCWRALLWDRLQRTGFTNIDFVGTLPGGGCNLANWDGDNEGHGGFQATGIANQNQLPGWLAATHPDIVLMHLGTNDIWGNIPAATILAAYSTLIDQMRVSNPNMKILVAQIIPMTPSGCTWCPPGVSALNNAIPSWAAGKTTAQSPITVVDQFTGFDSVADTIGDGVHPDDSGFQKMSDRWYPALVPLLGGPTTTPTATTSPTRSPTVSPSAPPSTPDSGGCTATYKVVNQWTGGFQADVTVKNGRTTPTSTWTATFTFDNGQQITQSWSATVTSVGATVTARNLSYNGNLAPGGSSTFGFLASWNGTNAVPAVTCTLG
jgi:lysophospholipase L1-like esterase